jgi:hypothetical protein
VVKIAFEEGSHATFGHKTTFAIVIIMTYLHIVTLMLRAYFERTLRTTTSAEDVGPMYCYEVVYNAHVPQVALWARTIVDGAPARVALQLALKPIFPRVCRLRDDKSWARSGTGDEQGFARGFAPPGLRDLMSKSLSQNLLVATIGCSEDILPNLFCRRNCGHRGSHFCDISDDPKDQ